MDGQAVRYRDEPRTGFRRRFVANLLKLLSIELATMTRKQRHTIRAMQVDLDQRTTPWIGLSLAVTQRKGQVSWR